MAAPLEKTVLDLSGSWVMNRTLSSDADAILAFQGISWMTRTMVSLATVTLNVKQWKDEEGKMRVDIDQTLTGGIQGSSEHRTLDWTDRMHNDPIFGEVKGRSRVMKTSELGDEAGDEEDKKHLKQNWEDSDGDKIQSYVRSESMGWDAIQEIDGQRYHCRNLVLHKNGEAKRERLVYDYVGEAPKPAE